MAERTRPEDDKTLPNRAANMEKAEGDRDTPNENARELTNQTSDAKKPFVTAVDPADEDKNVTHPAARRSRP